MISINGITPRYSTAPSSTGTPGTNSTGNTSNSNSEGDAITNAAGGTLGQDDFVKLLVTQMQNQDPMDPMDGKDLAAQLAQFSSVEQLMNINTKLDTMTSLLTPANASGTNSTSAS